MLQKIVNGIAIASGVISLTVVGIGGYVFIRKDAIIDSVKGKVMEAVTEKLGGLGDLGGGALGGVSGSLGLPSPSTPTPDGTGESDASCGLAMSGISDPPSAPVPSPPGNTDSITLLLTFSIIASLRMNT